MYTNEYVEWLRDENKINNKTEQNPPQNSTKITKCF